MKSISQPLSVSFPFFSMSARYQISAFLIDENHTLSVSQGISRSMVFNAKTSTSAIKQTAFKLTVQITSNPSWGTFDSFKNWVQLFELNCMVLVVI